MARGTHLILDRYEPLGTAGEGGFGTVEIAWDPRIQRKVAIKTIRLTELDAYRAGLPGAQAVAASPTRDRWHGAQPWSEYLEAEEPQFDDRYARQPNAYEYGPDDIDAYDSFDDAGYPGYPDYDDRLDQVTSLSHLPGLDEARTAAMLSDPRIVTVYDFEIRGRMAYLIMEYVEGITLTQLLSDYADFLTLDMVTAVFDAMAGALTVAHKAGVLHLDIKPDNIILNAQGQAKVTDFGLATLADASGAGTTGGGTIGYMPLEQMRREHLDARTDEWSLASVAYEMLTGDNPFRVETLQEAEATIENAELVLPSLCWDNMDPQIDDVLFYALDPQREERYDSVADFAEEADKFLGDAARGREQLALVVEDALGLGEVDEDDEQDYADDGLAPSGVGFFSWLANALGVTPANRQGVDRSASARRPFEDDWGYDDEPSHTRVQRKAQGAATPHTPLAQSVGDGVMNVLSRGFAAVASGFCTWLALTNLPFFPSAFGMGTMFFGAVGALVVAAIAAIVPHVGALAAFGVLGVSLIACGHPIPGGALIIAAALWWYLVGKRSVAGPNVALSMPLLGAIGGASAVPILSGAALRLVPALITSLLAAVIALVLAALGSNTLTGWDAASHWSFARIDVTGNLLALLKQGETWATLVGWLAATAGLSLGRMGNSRVLTVLGLAFAAAAVIAGTLAFGAPTPQLIVSVVLACAAVLVAFL